MIILGYVLGTYLLFSVGNPCVGVIGVAFNQDGIVKYVFRGSPAELADIREEDKLLYARSTKGTPGTVANVKFIRDGQLIKKDVDRVCVDELQSLGTW